ncbi:uncharacterized protein LOC135397487 [Ornithodoros turicata]|uniref:uncharacterized protein LOC135397487 n=1 Tax=Ornithodoros turicata TaxID=34597 RepID=UPI003138EE6D
MDPQKQDEIKRIARQISSQSLQLKSIFDSLLRKRRSSRGSEDADDDYDTQIPTTTHISRRPRPPSPQQVTMQACIAEKEPENPRPYANDPVWCVWENNMLKLTQLLKMLLTELRNVSEYTMQDDHDAAAEEAYLNRVATSKLIGGYHNREKVRDALTSPPPEPPPSRRKSKDQTVAERRSKQGLGEYFKRLAAQMDLLAETLKPVSPSAGSPMHARLLPLEEQVGRMAANIAGVSKAIAKPVDPIDILLAKYAKTVSFQPDRESGSYVASNRAPATSSGMSSDVLPQTLVSGYPLTQRTQSQLSQERIAQAVATQARAMQAQAVAAQAMEARRISTQGYGGLMVPGLHPGMGATTPMTAPGMIGPGMMAPGMMGPGMMGPGMMGPGMMGPGMTSPCMMGPGMMGPGMMGPGMMGPSGGGSEVARRSSSDIGQRTRPLYRGISKLTDHMQCVSGLFKEALGVVPAETRLSKAEQEEIRFCLDRLTRNMENMTTDLRSTMLTTTVAPAATKDEKKDKQGKNKKGDESESVKDSESEEQAGRNRGGKKGGGKRGGRRDDDYDEDY